MASLNPSAANRPDARDKTSPTPDVGETFVLPEADAEAVEARKILWRETYRPSSDEHEWLFELVVVNSVRLDHCRRLETELRTQEARRARLFWDEDRRLDAEAAGTALARRPALTVRILRRSPQGCDWLAGRWVALGRAFDEAGSWTAAQRALALNLLGTPAELREAVSLEDPAGLAAREVAHLERLRADALDELDDAEREAAEIGLDVAPSRALARLRRYEAACHRRYQWAHDRLTGRRPCGAGAPRLGPEPAAPPPFDPPPPPAPAPAPVPGLPAIFRDALACKAAAAPTAPEPPASAARPLLNHSIPVPPRFVNRRARRAAEKLAGKSR